jgi:hypothetical protein
VKLIRASHTAVRDFDLKCACGETAMVLMEVHAVHCCTEDDPTRAQFYCDSCFTRDLRRIADILMRRPQECSNCGLTMVAISDMVVRLCRIR